MNPVGYLRKYPDKLVGERGQYYTYIVAANGVFVEAMGPLLSARVLVAECPIRGLAPAETMMKLTYGSIPQRFWNLTLDAFMAEPDKERYVAITAAGGYDFYVPEQEVTNSKVRYKTGNNVVLDIHSHAHMPAFFSQQDDTDETGFRLYAVVGEVDASPVVRVRVGVYGYFQDIPWSDIFEGPLAGARQYQGEEAKAECDIRSKPKEHGRQLEYPTGWLRGDWWLRS